MRADTVRMQKGMSAWDSVHHAQLRKPWNKVFSAESLHAYEDFLIARIRQLNSDFCLGSSQAPGRVDIAEWINSFLSVIPFMTPNFKAVN